MGSCAWFGTVSGDCSYIERKRDRRERDVAVLSGGKLTEEGELQCGCPQIIPPRRGKFMW